MEQSRATLKSYLLAVSDVNLRHLDIKLIWVTVRVTLLYTAIGGFDDIFLTLSYKARGE